MHKNAKIKVSAAGSSGYTGAELLRLLVAHPKVEIGSCLANSQAGTRLQQHFGNFIGHLDKELEKADWSKVGAEHDLVFLCLPHGESQEPVMELLKAGCKVIDLGADFRLKAPSLYRSTYGQEHRCPELLGKAVYGMPEAYREAIKETNLVANPGCYPTASILAMLPVIESGTLVGPVIVDAKSGVSGAGRSAKIDSLYGEVNENVKAYGVGVHRHGPEIEQAAGVPVLFTPHLIPMTRGILATVYLQKDPTELASLYREFYKDEPFVTVLDGQLPSTKWVAGTNRCHLAVCAAHHPGYSIVVSAIDNLGKGAAGTAVHNMNLLFDLPEETGLQSLALAP